MLNIFSILSKGFYFRSLNLGLRSVTLASRFILIFFLARFLEPSELGLYGLVVATIAYALFFLGLDFYTYTTRELISLDVSEWGKIIKNHSALTLVLYGLFLPFFLVLFTTGKLPWSLAIWFFILLIIEHLNQELMRLMVAMSQPVMANLFLFLRQAAWVIILIPIMYLDKSMRNINAVLTFWAVGGCLALMSATVVLNKSKIAGWDQKVEWQWIRKGLKVSFPLLISTLAIRGLFTFDRYFFEELAGLDALGAYVFFFGIATAIYSFIDAGVFSFCYPRLIKAFQSKDEITFRIVMNQLTKQTLVLVVAFALCSLLLIDPLLDWLNKAIYQEKKEMFGWILLAIVFYVISMIPHYGLYAQGKDSHIIISHILGLMIFLIATKMLTTYFFVLAIPISLCIAFFCITMWKTVAFLQLIPARHFHQK